MQTLKKRYFISSGQTKHGDICEAFWANQAEVARPSFEIKAFILYIMVKEDLISFHLVSQV